MWFSTIPTLLWHNMINRIPISLTINGVKQYSKHKLKDSNTQKTMQNYVAFKFAVKWVLLGVLNFLKVVSKQPLGSYLTINLFYLIMMLYYIVQCINPLWPPLKFCTLQQYFFPKNMLRCWKLHLSKLNSHVLVLS